MGALGHFLEAEGIPTTQISLIREHTMAIKPPRALWVPFELGRPLGRPADADLQRRVLAAALDLFRAPRGPVLVDFDHEGPDQTAAHGPETAVWACPVSFAAPVDGSGDIQQRIHRFRLEVAELRNWYDLGLGETGRTSIVDFDPDTAAQLLSAYVLDRVADSPHPDLSFAVALRLSAQDLKAFYFEAVIARPGAAAPDSKTFNHWFWAETAAGQVLKAVKEKCLNEKDPLLHMTGAMLLVPLDQG